MKRSKSPLVVPVVLDEFSRALQEARGKLKTFQCQFKPSFENQKFPWLSPKHFLS
jgi:hypothetical protein